MATLADIGGVNATTKTLAVATGVYFVNDYYDGTNATGPTGVSRPLSTWYGSLGAAQAAYPAATALTNEVDWCAWQQALNVIYTAGVVGGSNFASATLIANGNYITNLTITGNFLAVKIVGTGPNDRFITGGTTSITYNGSNGTIDDPIYILDCYLYDEFGNPPPGRVGNAAAGGGLKVIVEHIVFNGKSGSMTSASQNVSGYISGLRIRKAEFAQVENCSFGGTLQDGIVCTGPQLFLIVDRNIFYAVHRDGVSVLKSPATSTTTWIYNNEFGWTGRYAVYLDLSGSVEAFPIIRDNSFEQFQTSSVYYMTHPEWWVQGVIAGSCIIGGGNLVWNANRSENINSFAGVWGCLHLIASTFPSISECTGANIIFAAYRNSDRTTSDFDTYYSANNFSDITDQRNYNAGYSGDNTGACDQVTIRKMYGLGRLYVIDTIGLSSSNVHSLEDCSASIWSIPVTDGTYAKIVQPTSTAILSLLYATSSNFNMRNVLMTDSLAGLRWLKDSGWGRATYNIYGGPTAFGQWAALTAFTLNTLKAPLTENGFFYQVIVAGTSGAGEPAFPTSAGTVGDGSIVWKFVGPCYYNSETNVTEWSEGGMRNRNGTAAPGIGSWSVGDRIWNTVPVGSGSIGFVNTTAGSPGTWRTWGPIGP